MDFNLQLIDLPANDVGVYFELHSDNRSKFPGDHEYALSSRDAGTQHMRSGLDEKLSFTDKISPLTDLQPFSPNYALLKNAMDSTSLRPSSMDGPKMPLSQRPIRSAMPTSNQLHTTTFPLNSSPLPVALRSKLSLTRRSPSIASSTILSDDPSISIRTSTRSSTTCVVSSYTTSTFPGESERTHRARYAANQRHGKVQKARQDSTQNEDPSGADSRVAQRKQRRRINNKVAAAKCRSRQRMHVNHLQEKASRLGEQNVKLKTMIQDLRGELFWHRSIALDHQRCNCHIARYNHSQVEKVMACYRNSPIIHTMERFELLPQQQ